MSVKSCEKLDKSKVALTIEADAAAFEAAINKAYLQQRSKISVPGFRPGKAPRKMIESMYGAEVFYEEAVNILLPDAYEAAVKEQELKVVGYPEVELESCGKDGVVFKCTVAVYPEVTLGQYKGLEAPKAEVNVTDEDVDNRLNEMADRNSRLVSVEREIQKGDTADIDFEGFDNGVPFDGGKGENFDLEIGSGSFVPGFEDQLVGMKAALGAVSVQLVGDLREGYRARGNVHQQDHGEVALFEDGLADVENVDVVLREQGADGGDDADAVPAENGDDGFHAGFSFIYDYISHIIAGNTQRVNIPNTGKSRYSEYFFHGFSTPDRSSRRDRASCPTGCRSARRRASATARRYGYG